MEVIQDNLVVIIIGLLSITSIVGYGIKTWIDAKFKKRERAEQYKFDDLRTQRERLQGFLGDPMSSLNQMLHQGINWTSDQRQEKAAIVGKWIEKHRAEFPSTIQTELTKIRNKANVMITDEGMGQELRNEIKTGAIEQASEIIINYIEKIDQELRNK